MPARYQVLGLNTVQDLWAIDNTRARAEVEMKAPQAIQHDLMYYSIIHLHPPQEQLLRD
jgi:hypothetical protein